MSDTEQDFDLQILKERDGGGRYRVNVIQSPAGEADGEFSLPFSEREFDELFRGLGQVRKTTRGAASPEVANAREFGTKLFDQLFSGDVRDCLYSSRGRTQAAGHGLRIRLRLTKVPELLDLPWELFFDRRYSRFIALDDGITLVRHLPVAEPVIPMRVDAPLRVLVAISNPRGDLDTEQEWTKLSDALASLSERGLVEVERLQPTTFDGLVAKLRNGIFHVLHFLGHGGYDAATQSGFLSFELLPRDEKRVGAMRLADLLRPFRTLRLVVLNACEGGRTSREDAFAGVAQSLVQSAIPAVVAMQFPVTDAAAIVFAGAFYAGLADGRSVDLALADARREVNLNGEEGDIEWATPVLYMRGSGALFDVNAKGRRTREQFEPKAMRGIYISYRRMDTERTAGRLFDDLTAHFGRDAVFMDVAGIKKGLDFRRVIEEHIAPCGVMLVMIGKRWLIATDSKGRRCLDDPNDSVRLETAAALARGIPIVPVLVHDAARPTEQELPDELKELAFRNGTELTHARWASDVKSLIEDLRPYVLNTNNP